MRIAILPCTGRSRYGHTTEMMPELMDALTALGHTCLVLHPFASRSGALTGLPPSVSCLDLGYTRSREGVAHARRQLLDASPDLVLALYDDASPLPLPALLNGSGIPLLLAEMISPAVLEEECWMPYERRACLAAADSIVLRHAACLEALPAFLHGRARIIPEYAPAVITAEPDRDDAEKIVLVPITSEQDMAGGLMLLTAFATLAPAAPGWTLHFLADAADAATLEAMAARAGLAERVSFSPIGPLGNVGHAAARLLFLPALHLENGAPVLDAWRSGLPVLAMQGCPEASALIRDGHNGILTPAAVDGVFRTLSLLLKRPQLRARLAAEGRHSLSGHLSESVFPLWDAAIQDVSRFAGRTALSIPQPDSREAQEEARAEIALREILARRNPAIRPACALHYRREDQLARDADRAATESSGGASCD
ncbi:glycosyltransferase [Desulfovibrio sp. OttesenSCG-928-I05]|nr:glycosyltransferase [Desulfovibrio sp. OttesenSCG-928-I05]